MMTHIYILYNYKLYKLIIKIYVYKYVSKKICSKKIFVIADLNGFVPIFVIITKINTISLSF